jgi:DNA-binding transcriptional LysR family regulator
MPSSNSINLLLQHRLKIRHLVLLTAIAKDGTLLKAAESLHVTQSAATKALRELEEGLKISLFDRSPRGVTPTAFGLSLINHAKAILSQVHVAAEELTELKLGSAGRVVVGTLRAAAPSLLPRTLIQLRSKHPGIGVTIFEGTLDVLGPALRAGEIDFLVGYLPEFRPLQGLSQERLYYDAAAVVVRCGHPVLQRKRVSLKHLINEQWILPLPDTVLRRHVDNVFRRLGCEPPNSAIESYATMLIQSLLLQSDMIAVLPYQVAVQLEKFGLLSILPIALEGASLPVGITTRANQPLTAAAKTLVDILRGVAREVGAKRDDRSEGSPVAARRRHQGGGARNGR